MSPATHRPAGAPGLVWLLLLACLGLGGAEPWAALVMVVAEVGAPADVDAEPTEAEPSETAGLVCLGRRVLLDPRRLPGERLSLDLRPPALTPGQSPGGPPSRTPLRC